MNKNRGVLTLPAAIIIAGSLMAIAMVWISRPEGGAQTDDDTAMPNLSAAAGMATVTAGDHILGNPNAPIKFVEYSDPSCPFCKLFHPTMERIISMYGPSGNVAWVYRQVPLSYPDAEGNILHPNSGIQAEALECAASMGGNSAFFGFLKEWFIQLPEDGSGALRDAEADLSELKKVADKIGLDKLTFDECLNSRKFKDKVRESYEEALNAGITGTPYTILVTPTGKRIILSGIQSYSTLKGTVDTLILTLPSDSSPASTTSAN